MAQNTDSNFCVLATQRALVVDDVFGHAGGLDHPAADVFAGHVSGLQYRSRHHVVAGHVGSQEAAGCLRLSLDVVVVDVVSAVAERRHNASDSVGRRCGQRSS